MLITLQKTCFILTSIKQNFVRLLILVSTVNLVISVHTHTQRMIFRSIWSTTWPETPISICFTSKLYGALLLWIRVMIQKSVCMLIICRISDENLINLNTTQIGATFGTLKSSLPITMKKAVSKDRLVHIVMVGLRTISIQIRINLSLVRLRESAGTNTVLFTIMRKINENLRFLMNSLEFSLKSEKLIFKQDIIKKGHYH